MKVLEAPTVRTQTQARAESACSNRLGDRLKSMRLPVVDIQEPVGIRDLSDLVNSRIEQLKLRKHAEKHLKDIRAKWEFLIKRTQFLTKRKTELNVLREELMVKRRELATVEHKTRTDMTASERMLDTLSTRLEFEYMQAVQLYNEQQHEAQKMHADLLTMEASQKSLKRKFEDMEVEIQCKRRRMEQTYPTYSIYDAEALIARAVITGMNQRVLAMDEVHEQYSKFQCTICAGNTINAVVTCCKHALCTTCTSTLTTSANASCPFCRQPLTSASVIEMVL